MTLKYKFYSTQIVKRHLPKLMALLLFFLIVNTIYGQDHYRPVADQEMIQSKLKEIAATTSTIQCEFVQEKKVSFMDRTVTSSGKLYFREDHLRWEYLEPYHYAILMVEDKLTIIDEGDVNETNLGKNPAFKKIQSLLSHTLTGDFSGQQDYFSQTIEESDSYYRIVLMPIEDQIKDYVSSMEIYFSKKDFIVHQFIMNENGDLTKTTFSNQKINEQLPSDIFNWK